MDFDWSQYKLSKKLEFDTPLEYILILPDREKLLITYKSNIKIYNIQSFELEGQIKFENIENIENLYLLKSGLISIVKKNIIFIIELNEDNTYKIFQTIEFPELNEIQDFKHLIELKNSNLCILSKNKIYIFEKGKTNNKYKNIITLIEDYIQYKETNGYNESCIELVYPEKNIENKIAVYLSNVIRLSFWDLNSQEKINDTDNNYCNTFDCKDIFCLMDKGKYLLCACIDEAIKFYSTETCDLVKTLYDNYWHITVLKLNEEQILSGSDFGTITFYQFDFEKEEFMDKDLEGLDMKQTEKVEKKVDLIVPEEYEEKEGEYGHGKAINQIKKFGDSIISSSCYEKDKKFFVCVWSKD